MKQQPCILQPAGCQRKGARRNPYDTSGALHLYRGDTLRRWIDDQAPGHASRMDLQVGQVANGLGVQGGDIAGAAPPFGVAVIDRLVRCLGRRFGRLASKETQRFGIMRGQLRMGDGPARMGDMAARRKIDIVEADAPAAPQVGGAAQRTHDGGFGADMMIVQKLDRRHFRTMAGGNGIARFQHGYGQSLSCTSEGQRQADRAGADDADIRNHGGIRRVVYNHAPAKRCRVRFGLIPPDNRSEPRTSSQVQQDETTPLGV